MSAAARLSVRVLEKFNSWFTSAAGVWQTLIAVGAWSIYEILNPTADDHGFILMCVLTVYSAVTQPALAYVAAKSAQKTDEDLRRDELILAHIEKLITERKDG